MTTAEATTLDGIIIPCEDNTIVKVEQLAKVTDIFTSEGVVDAIIAFVSNEARAFTPDLSTAAGRKAIASRAYRVAQTKTYLDDLGKEEVARLKELPKAIDAGRKRLRDALDALKDEIRKPLTEWEERAEAMKQRLADMQAIPDQLMVLSTTDSERIKSAMESLEAHPVDAETWGEFAEDAAATKAAALAKLQTMLDARLKFEADQAELERLRKAEADREAEEQRRAANEEHRRTFNREAMADIAQALRDAGPNANDGVETMAKAVLCAIAKGQVRHVAIHY